MTVFTVAGDLFGLATPVLTLGRQFWQLPDERSELFGLGKAAAVGDQAHDFGK